MSTANEVEYLREFTNMATIHESKIDGTEPPHSNDQLAAILASLDSFPPFPATATQILTQCEKPDVDVQTVVKLIECEPMIGAKVIMLANSPLYGATRPISTISHSIVILGFRSVAQMAVAIAAGEVFGQGDPKLAEIRRKTYMHSLACATSARMISHKLALANPDEAFLSGVMHDIGKLVFLEAIPEQYCEILRDAQDGRTTHLEQTKFGIDHASLGKACGAKWGLPAQISLAINDHHLPIEEIEQDLSQVVVAANYFARQWQIGFDESEIGPVSAEIEHLFNPEILSDMQFECQEQFAAVLEICAI